MTSERSNPRNDDNGPPAADARQLERRLAFLELSSDDAQRLRGLAQLFLPRVDAFVEAFYRHLFDFEETSRLLDAPGRVERLKELQKSHFESLLSADWDEAYVERRRRVGQSHADVGVQPRFFLGAYYQYLQYCLRLCSSGDGARPKDVFESFLSLVKVVFLDIGLTLDAYFTQSTDHMQSALDMVWKANHDLRQFAQLTTHDLKTPLATVANLCDEAIDEFGPDMPEGARKLVEAARAGAFRMSRMIDELLASAIVPRPDEPSRVSSGLAFAEAIERVRPQLDERGIELVVPNQWPTVRGDDVRLREAAYNVLSNAAKFIDTTPGRIVISVEVDGPRCRFCVADSGPGIPAEELDRIFVPFRRLPMHRDRPGSGLGLYFTKNLIEEQGGRVWAESKPGQGSQFYLELPLA
jgi:signal transduction histidine kinase